MVTMIKSIRVIKTLILRSLRCLKGISLERFLLCVKDPYRNETVVSLDIC